jgi:error-prone DNA polymerase
VRNLANGDAAAIVAARADTPYTSVEDVQRRAGVGRGALDRLGDADGFGSLALSRRTGLWQVKGLRDAPLPLFAAADAREGRRRAEAIEPAVALAPMREGAEVVEDYRAAGLSLRAHPLTFLREELKARRMVSCAELRSVKDGRWVELAGIVLVRQKPGSARGVMFITLEDETDVANLVVWTNIFEKNRRVVLGASMMGVRGRVQREGEVIHVIAERLDDLSPLLASVGDRRQAEDVYRLSRADVVKHGMGPDPRDSAGRPLGQEARTIYVPDLRLGSGIIAGQPTEGIKIKPRDFR